MTYLVLTVLLPIVQASAPVPRQAPNRTTSTSNRSQENPGSKNKPTDSLPSSVNKQEQAQEHNQPRKQQTETDTQHSVTIRELPPVTIRNHRDWADWGTWFFAFLLVVTSALQVWLLCRTLAFARRQTHEMKRQRSFMRLQWKAMQEQIKLADEQFLSSHRPWVTIWGEIKNQPLVFRDGKASIAISFFIKNGGTAPALNTVTINQGLVFGPMPSTISEAQAIIDCGKDSPTAAINKETGALILPDEIHPVDYELTTQNLVIDRPQEVWFPLCIRYKDERGNFHGTGFLWKFIHVDGSHQIKPIGVVGGRFIKIGIGNQAH